MMNQLIKADRKFFEATVLQTVPTLIEEKIKHYFPTAYPVNGEIT